VSNDKISVAIDFMKKTFIHGKIKALASANPLQTRLKLILTDFNPNDNKVGIPKEEAESIIETAINQPFKINFNGLKEMGHRGAWPVGTIVSAQLDTYQDNEVISGEAIIWNHEFPEVAEYLKDKFANDGVRTSWEILYDTAETREDSVNWLRGCLFAGTCVVEVPAYGKERTRVLAIAEKLFPEHNTMTIEELQNQVAELQATVNTLTQERDARLQEVSERNVQINELTTQLEQYKTAEAERQRLEKRAARQEQLKKFNITDEAVYDLDDAAFNVVVSTLESAKIETAEKKTDPTVPQFPTSGDVDLSTLAKEVGKLLKNKE
jgi:Fe-S oxidoreductase